MKGSILKKARKMFPNFHSLTKIAKEKLKTRNEKLCSEKLLRNLIISHLRHHRCETKDNKN